MRSLAFLAVLVALRLPAAATPAPPLEVAVSVPPQAWLVERLGGERVVVTAVLVPPGTSPETYAPRPRLIVAASRAALYVRVGHPHFLFERRYVDPLLAASPRLAVVDLWREDGGNLRDDEDPHLWLAPPRVAAAASRLATALAALDPSHAGLYRTNLHALRAEIAALDGELAGLYRGRRGGAFLVAHPAWGVFARHYGLRQMAIEGEHRPPSPRRLVALIAEARRRGFPVVFAQPGHPARAAELVARQIGARVERLDPLARDWPANLRRAATAIAAGLGA